MAGGGERDQDWVKPDLAAENGEMNRDEEAWIPLIVEGESAIELSEYENSLLRAKILDLEKSVGFAVQEKEEMARKCSALVIEKVLTEQRARDEIAELQREMGRLRENMRKGFEEEKARLEKLELKFAGMEIKIEQSEDELGKLNKRHRSLDRYVDCLNSEPESYSYPDPEFNDFGKHKAEGCFAVNQCWAAYDYANSMPRYYVLVTELVTPFKLKLTLLEPDPDDQEEIDWDQAYLPVACGKFSLGGHSEIVTKADLVILSHQMKTSGQGSYLIYPNKGETWAIFRDWDIKWSSDPENHLTNEFEYVEILSDFDENVGIEVAYLGNVKGFVSLFEKKAERNNGDINIYSVLPNEIYKFSHRIPSCKMTGNEREGVPRGCFEFDTAALPSKFFEDGDSSDV